MPSEKMQFKIAGMDCAEEVSMLKKELIPLLGDDSRLSFDVMNEILSVAQGGTEVTQEAIQQAVARTGMQALVWKEGTRPEAPEGVIQRWGRTWLAGLSAIMTAAGFVTHAIHAGSFRQALGSEGMGLASPTPLIVRVLYGMGIMAGAWFVLPRAFLALRRFQPDMNLLMVISVIGAAWIGDWLEAATVACLFSISLLLEKWSVGHARRAVETLLDLTPPLARLLHPNGQQQEVPPDQVPVGSALLVKPGERFALDGVVVQGSSYVNQAPMTGESVPVAKEPGDLVFAGTINGDGAVEMRSTRTAGATTLAHLIRMVSEAQSRRSHSEQWVERFAQIYTPLVLVLALALFIIPPLLLGGDWADWFYRALVLLVIACPCALVISTPVSIVAGIAAAARQGVLIKGGAYLELPGRLRAMAFDKTGTLTKGQLQVVEVVPLNGHSANELLERAAGLEAHSEHPLGKAIAAHAEQHGIEVRPVQDYQVVPGKGATAKFEGRSFWIGSRRFLEEQRQGTDEIRSQLDTLSLRGVTIVAVGNEHHLCGYLGLADTVRPRAAEAVKELHQLGIAPVVMLTGDSSATANAIAHATGVDEVKAELLPADKVAQIESLVSQHVAVAMVGDGVNDAPAMARASLGIAMGAAGSDTALETADIALMSDDLSRLPWLIRHSRRTLAIIQANITFALVVKFIFVALTLFGFASMWAAIAADMGASLLVILNGLRLLQPRDGRNMPSTLNRPAS